MKIIAFDTYLANAGLRNYLFIQLRTDNGLTGVGEASLEWQELTVETICHEWVKDRVLGCDPFDIEAVIGGMVRDQYQGGSTVLTAISGVEIAFWDLIGKACNQPVYRLLGGRCHRRLPAYANGWYGGARNPLEYAELAKEAVGRGYRALKFDPFGIAWKDMQPDEIELAEELVATIREAVGPKIGLMIEYHGRLSVGAAVDMIRRLDPYQPTWSEEPVAPESIDLLAEVKRQVSCPIAAGERLYTLQDFYRLCSLRACDVVQMDLAHCGGLWIGKKIAAMAAVQDMRVAPHCSVGPVALAAALHFDISTPNFMVQETFAEFDVPWRSELVKGWNPIREGELCLSDEPGLGIEIDESEIAQHPYVKNAFPSLWDNAWLTDFKQDDKTSSDGGTDR
ncbi:MAG TPA: mandelate racemase/muconate lactonizing enzyme family protein [Anaerolineales bacterium]|nr:mandelate racemase/muconate lactonizing enzyme family protein [Anaerolineales bacterium]